MKKILLVFGVFLMVNLFFQAAVKADEIIDSRGELINCKIITVADGLIEYEKDGCMLSFQREINDPVFSDYVDVKKNLFKDVVFERISGYVSYKGMGGVVIKRQDEIINIPWYRVQNTGIYRPN